MKLHDARPAKEHIAELSRELQSSVTIRAAIFRRFNEKGREHVGTLVQDVGRYFGFVHLINGHISNPKPDLSIIILILVLYIKSSAYPEKKRDGINCLAGA